MRYKIIFFSITDLKKKKKEEKKKRRKILVNFFLTKSLLKILKNIFNEIIKTFKTNLDSHTLTHLIPCLVQKYF